MKRLVDLQTLAGPATLVVAAALLGTTSLSTQSYFTDALVKVGIVVGLYVFVGNSGVVSFGHISFVAIGAWTAGVLSVPAGEKPAIMPNLAHFLRDRTTGNISSLVLAAVVGGICALVVALPLMRLSGLAAGIATFAVLEITHNLLRYEERIGPGLNTFSSVPETTGLRQAALGALFVVVVAFAYSRSRYGRLLRATREDDAAARAVGTSVYRQRLIAFAISGALVRARGRALRAPAAVEHRDRVPRSDIHHARHARDRRRDEPLGRSDRGAGREWPRLVPGGGGERHLVPRLAHRPAGGDP